MPTMTKPQKEAAVLAVLAQLDALPNTPDYDRVSIEVVMDGYKYHASRMFMPDNPRPVCDLDVEYLIQVNNQPFVKTKRDYRAWSCFVYINRPGYWNCDRFKSIGGTDYGVQFMKGF